MTQIVFIFIGIGILSSVGAIGFLIWAFYKEAQELKECITLKPISRSKEER